MTTFKRIWWEDGVHYEQDVDPADVYLSAEEIAARTNPDFKTVLKTADAPDEKPL